MQPVVAKVEVEVAATPEVVWSSMIDGFGTWFTDQEGKSLGMRLEPRAGGRLYRDTGAAEHLWAVVQVIKAPVLLELNGPLFVSSASISHVSFRLEPIGSGTRVKLEHRAIGDLPDDFAESVSGGWRAMLEEGLKAHAERN